MFATTTISVGALGVPYGTHGVLAAGSRNWGGWGWGAWGPVGLWI